MARRLRPLGFGQLPSLPCACVGCVYWETPSRLEARCGAACDLELLQGWFETVTEEWGSCGLAACEEDEVLGFIKYAPPHFFPQQSHVPGGPADGEAVLIACMHVRDDARRHGLGSLLLKGALHDLAGRGTKTVQAFACTAKGDMTYQPVMGMDFLLRNGFTVARPDPVYPLLRLDMRSLVSWTENLEAVLQSLRIPLRSPGRVPSPSIRGRS